MLDVLFHGATVIDGTGGPSRQAHVGVRDGRVVTIVDAATAVDEPARDRIDATGLVLCPGVIDPHTHYDAQLFWDPSASPSNIHGVTSVIGGNCSFALAPVRPGDADYLRRMMAKVEGMPLTALEVGLPWSWESFGDYLDALDDVRDADGRTGLGVNAGFIVGHSALRRYVLGAESNQRAATDAEIAELRRVLGVSLAAGGLGFSTDISMAHSDGEGRPVPARGATPDELVALCDETGRHPGTTLAGIFQGGSDGFSDTELELLTAMSRAADRPLNWNVLVVDAQSPARIDRQMALSHYTRQHGGRIVALSMPTIVPMNMSFGTYCALFLIPGWREVMGLAPAARMQALRDPATRRRLEACATSDAAGMYRRLSDFAGYTIGDTFATTNQGLSGRVVRDIARERGADPFDTLIDIVLADDLRTVLWPSTPDDDDAHWKLRTQLWRDPDVLLGGSDAGAHLDRMTGAGYATEFFADSLRGRQLLPIEQAVHTLTGAPAALFGLRDRGVVREGAIADLVLFDPATVGASPARIEHDLPGGSVRMVTDSLGVVRVLVNGVATVVDGRSTGERPGTTLRSGRDTYSVTVH